MIEQQNVRSAYFIFENNRFQHVIPTNDGYLLEDGTTILNEEKSTPWENFCSNKALQIQKSISYHLNTFRPTPTPSLLKLLSGIEESRWEYLDESESQQLQNILASIIPELDSVFKQNQERLYHESEEFARLVIIKI
jgi:hypothetical protein